MWSVGLDGLIKGVVEVVVSNGLNIVVGGSEGLVLFNEVINVFILFFEEFVK